MMFRHCGVDAASTGSQCQSQRGTSHRQASRQSQDAGHRLVTGRVGSPQGMGLVEEVGHAVAEGGLPVLGPHRLLGIAEAAGVAHSGGVAVSLPASQASPLQPQPRAMIWGVPSMQAMSKQL